MLVFWCVDCGEGSVMGSKSLSQTICNTCFAGRPDRQANRVRACVLACVHADLESVQRVPSQCTHASRPQRIWRLGLCGATWTHLLFGVHYRRTACRHPPSFRRPLRSRRTPTSRSPFATTRVHVHHAHVHLAELKKINSSRNVHLAHGHLAELKEITSTHHQPSGM